MKNKELIYFSLACVGIITSIILFVYLMMFMAIANDLSNEVTELRQENTELRWQLEQVNQMICNNDMLDYEVK